jgi:hypothetical protein
MSIIPSQALRSSLLLSSFLLGTGLLPLQAQNLPESSPALQNDFSQGKSITLTAPDGKSFVFNLNSSARIPVATVTANTLLTIGVSPEAIPIAIDLVQSGANSDSVVTLMQNLQGLVAADNQASIAQLNQAIAAYNQIVDKSDLATLEALKTMPAFLNIKGLLELIQGSDQ